MADKRKVALRGALAVALIAVLIAVGVAARPTEDDLARIAASSASASSSSSDAGSSAGSGNAGGDSSSSVQAGASSSSGSSTGKLSSIAQSQLDGISEKLPFSGMSEELISETWLGAPDRKSLANSKDLAMQKYDWLSTNGKKEPVFSAYVKNGLVQRVQKWYTQTDYWYDSKTKSYKKFPDRGASGSAVKNYSSSGGTSSRSKSGGSSAGTSSSGATSKTPKEDPLDYSTPEEYADNAEDDFKSNGSTDSWNDAYRYWEDNAG